MVLANALGYDDLDALWDAALRFWARVDRSEGGCWRWTGGFMTAGYGELSYRGRKIGAHRFSYLLHTGELVPGRCVCHINTCNNRWCVNPKHLYQGSYKDNFEDILQQIQAARIPQPSSGDWSCLFEDPPCDSPSTCATAMSLP